MSKHAFANELMIRPGGVYPKYGAVDRDYFRKYWPWERDDRRARRTPSRHWATSVRNHADAIIACDFMVAVTAKFQLLYVGN
jgi:hypothetical protein